MCYVWWYVVYRTICELVSVKEHAMQAQPRAGLKKHIHTLSHTPMGSSDGRAPAASDVQSSTHADNLRPLPTAAQELLSCLHASAFHP